MDPPNSAGPESWGNSTSCWGLTRASFSPGAGGGVTWPYHHCKGIQHLVAIAIFAGLHRSDHHLKWVMVQPEHVARHHASCVSWRAQCTTPFPAAAPLMNDSGRDNVTRGPGVPNHEMLHISGAHCEACCLIGPHRKVIKGPSLKPLRHSENHRQGRNDLDLAPKGGVRGGFATEALCRLAPPGLGVRNQAGGVVANA